ncbi:MAG: hypothetical protein WC860_08165 [Candidatus Margulisiibacteriota bacterium]|jgi:hypothetical protein
MKSSIKTLHSEFYAQTDIKIAVGNKKNCSLQQLYDWQKYAKWLENLSIEKINNDLIKENNFLHKKIYESIDTLEIAISSRI